MYLQLKNKHDKIESKIYFIMDCIDHKMKVIQFNIILNKNSDALLPDKKIQIVKAFKYDKTIGREILIYNGYATEFYIGICNNVCNCSHTKCHKNSCYKAYNKKN